MLFRSLEFAAAYQDMRQLVMELCRDVRLNRHFLLMDCIGILQEQLEILDALKDIQSFFRQKNHMEVLGNLDYIMPLMFTMQTNALIREAQEKYDSATLLLYRLLEMIEQRRLCRYGIDVSRADFLNIQYNVKKLPAMKHASKEKCLEIYRGEVSQIGRAHV